MTLEFRPVTPERWDDFAWLFGERGACQGCWCMFFRHSGPEHRELGNAGNRAAMKALVRSGREPGIIAYREGRAVGWCSVAPREEFPRVERSETTKRLDDRPVWSIVCFYIDAGERGNGVARALLDAAIHHAGGRGARMMEAYPVDPAVRTVSADDAYHGLLPMFLDAGFTEAARRTPARPLVRLEIPDPA